MQALSEAFDLELPATPESVATARQAAADLARELGADEMNVKTAVSEAVGNAVIHAYPDQGDGEVRVTGAEHGDKLILVVHDDGVGMRPNPDSPGLRMGLPLMGRVTEDLHIDAHGGGTSISMSFPLGVTA